MKDFENFSVARMMEWVFGATQVAKEDDHIVVDVPEVPKIEVAAPDITPELLLFAVTFLLAFLFFIVIVTPKGRLSIWGVFYMLLSRDKRSRKRSHDTLDFETSRYVKVVFIRHGESEWNYIFNRGSIFVRPFRYLIGLVKEFCMLFEQDSLFLDSPLSSTGIQQSLDLLTFLSAFAPGCPTVTMASQPVAKLDVKDLVSIVRGDIGSSVVVSSNLRRAISTGVLGLSGRFLKTPPSDKIVLMTSLQEVSRNVDALALTPPRELPKTPRAEANMKNIGDVVSHFYKARIDKTKNTGNKTMAQTSVHRQNQFVQWAFEQKTECIIVCGHSLWFKEFFKWFLPSNIKHQAKETKLVNCGCVAFDLHCGGAGIYRINPSSVKEIYGGFEGKKTKKA
eukprot:TRINITY_DN74569_c0_g1_i1.p1 TRINITY_DN74569_c0_g1~~TRINITY_DN74569_c0_g1_i1.p1  ORF type:complete len:414 (+),score=59.28 TRINITY_DN74569_c0_g1_i1:66-1244(+)